MAQVSQTGTDTHSLTSWLLFKHSSHSKIIQALHRARDRYKFIPNVQREDKWVTPEGPLCLQELATHHQPSGWNRAPPHPGLKPTGFLSLSNHSSFWGERKASTSLKISFNMTSPSIRRPCPPRGLLGFASVSLRYGL